MLVGFVWLEFQVAGIYTEADEVFVGELDVIVTLANWGWLCFGDEFCFFGCGKQGDCYQAGACFVEVLCAEVSDGENFGESYFFAVSVDFTLDFEGGETVALEFTEFIEGFVGSTFLHRSDRKSVV